MGIWASQIPRIKVGFALNDFGLATIVLSFAVGAIFDNASNRRLDHPAWRVRTVVATGLTGAVSLALLGSAWTYAWLLAATLLTVSPSAKASDSP